MSAFAGGVMNVSRDLLEGVRGRGPFETFPVPNSKRMMSEETTGRQFLPVLIAGFTLLLLLLVGSGWVAIDSMRFIESDASRFVTEQQAKAHLIQEVQSEEGNLSNVFYALASGQDVDR